MLPSLSLASLRQALSVLSPPRLRPAQAARRLYEDSEPSACARAAFDLQSARTRMGSPRVNRLSRCDRLAGACSNSRQQLHLSRTDLLAHCSNAAVELHSLAAFHTLGPLKGPNSAGQDFPAILQESDKPPVLRQEASEVSQEMFGSPELKELATKMVKIMRAAPGVGLAAPQIGIGLKIIAIEDKKEYMERVPEDKLKELERHPFDAQVICNPRLRPIGDGGYRYWEGCLSVSGYQAAVARYTAVHLDGSDIDGNELSFKAKGWQARILQHECDHIHGILYIDRATRNTFMERKPPGEAEDEADIACGSCKCSHELR